MLVCSQKLEQGIEQLFATFEKPVEPAARHRQPFGKFVDLDTGGSFFDQSIARGCPAMHRDPGVGESDAARLRRLSGFGCHAGILHSSCHTHVSGITIAPMQRYSLLNLARNALGKQGLAGRVAHADAEERL